MTGVSGQFSILLAGLFLSTDVVIVPADSAVDTSYFEGRWAFVEETCDQATNWTMIAGGNFVSEDLIGTWEWSEDRLNLSLTDLAIDEETGEEGGRFQMEGPVEIKSSDAFNLTIEPDVL